jgi:hypothetical protein
MYADAWPVRIHDHETRAHADFDRALRRARLYGLLAAVARRPNGLLPYAEALRGFAVEGESYRGVAAVPVERIVGSMDRASDFDRDFRPRRADTAARWQRVALAHHAGVELPPVSLYRVGDAYFVVDGHHRVSAARALGRVFIDAVVIEIRARPVARPVAAGAAGRVTAGPALRRRLGALLVSLGTRVQGATGAEPTPA